MTITITRTFLVLSGPWEAFQVFGQSAKFFREVNQRHFGVDLSLVSLASFRQSSALCRYVLDVCIVALHLVKRHHQRSLRCTSSLEVTQSASNLAELIAEAEWIDFQLTRLFPS